MNEGIFTGMLTGITFGIVLAVLLIALCNKDRKIKTEYDERQQQVRGKGFKYAFFTVFGAIIVLIVLKAAEVAIPIHDSVVLFFIVVLGIAEYATYAILHDAYFGLNNKRSSYLMIFALIALINTFATIRCGIAGVLVVDGVLELNGINMLCAALFLWLFIVLIIKKYLDEKEDKGL